MTANPLLAQDRELTEYDIIMIEVLHDRRDKIHSRLARARKRETIDKLLAEWTENEYALQDLWGFERDSRLHRFWTIPSCRCPKMDNDDRCPSNAYIINSMCKLHWRE